MIARGDDGAGSPLAQVYLDHGNPIIAGYELAAIRAFESLLDEEGWRPENPYLGGFDPIIELGLLATILLDAPNSRKPLLEVMRSIRRSGLRDADLAAEIHMAAMLVHAGHAVEFVPRTKGKKTPDLRVLSYLQPIDVEVRRAQLRGAHNEFQQRLRSISDRFDLRDDADIVVHLGEAATAEIDEEVLRTAASIPVDHCAEVKGLWRVAAYKPPPSPGPDGLHDLVVENKIDPEWWSRPSFFSVRTQLNGARAPRFEIGGQVPLASYFNPIRDKADRPQRSGDFPYVIAIDTSSLPDAHKRLLPELHTAAPAWDHVSGVLMAYPFFAISQAEWRAALFRNPHATLGLEQSFLPGVGEVLSKMPL